MGVPQSKIPTPNNDCEIVIPASIANVSISNSVENIIYNLYLSLNTDSIGFVLKLLPYTCIKYSLYTVKFNIIKMRKIAASYLILGSFKPEI